MSPAVKGIPIGYNWLLEKRHLSTYQQPNNSDNKILIPRCGVALFRQVSIQIPISINFAALEKFKYFNAYTSKDNESKHPDVLDEN
jgi:hypothetical protein